MSLSRQQLKKLVTPLDPRRIQQREQDGKSFAYLEGWFVIQEANRIFGYDGWDRELVQSERVFTSKDGREVVCGYLARVRIRVRLGESIVIREGTGFGQAKAEHAGEAHERALKAAETDATKRALVTFGGRFGLLLYDKDEARTKPVGGPQLAQKPSHRSDQPFRMPPAKATPPSTDLEYWIVRPDGIGLPVAGAEAFCAGLRQLLEAAESGAEVDRLARYNAPILERLRARTELISQRGVHYADILDALVAKRRQVFAPGAEEGLAGPIEAPASVAASTRRAMLRSYVPVPPYPMAQLREQMTDKAVTEGEARSPVPPPADPSPEQVPDRPAEAQSHPPMPVQAAQPTRRSLIGGGFSIDKSVLAIPSERRLRSKAHLVEVASKPCLVCGEMPCHAHHITYAQPRGLSQKVSDEYTVPLCALHHNQLHAFGHEASWWRGQGIEPLAEAKRLWLLSAGDEGPVGPNSVSVTPPPEKSA